MNDVSVEEQTFVEKELEMGKSGVMIMSVERNSSVLLSPERRICMESIHLNVGLVDGERSKDSECHCVLDSY